MFMPRPPRHPLCRPLARILPIGILLVLATACARDPARGAAATAADSAPFPQLVPLAQITTLPPPDDPTATLTARAAALKARAAAMGTEG